MKPSQLKKHYQNLFKNTLTKVTKTNIQVDDFLNGKMDNRFGLTLLIRPNDLVKTNIQSFLDDLKKVEPNQYYYPNSDIHVTVLSIISCQPNFQLEQIEVQQYLSVIQKSIENIGSFPLHFKGVTASSSADIVSLIERLAN